MTVDESKSRLPPGGKKGGTIFPRINLKEAITYSAKAVSKTHTGPQSQEILYPGVFGSNSPNSQIKASALKQFGLLDGKADGYYATDLAKKISAAPEEEKAPLYRQACLAPKIFKTLFDTFHGDTNPISKIRQQAAANKIHPESLDKCVSLFAESVEFAKLGSKHEDNLTLVAAFEEKPSIIEDEEKSELSDSPEAEGSGQQPTEPLNPAVTVQPPAFDPASSPPSGRSVVHVNVTLDSSLDTEKLERQLALLRRYGAL